jgi:hypothetical protein
MPVNTTKFRFFLTTIIKRRHIHTRYVVYYGGHHPENGGRRMSSMLLITFIIAGVIGFTKPICGVLSGAVFVCLWAVVFADMTLTRLIVACLFGVIASGIGGYSLPWFFSGVKGGRQNTGPSFIGGDGGKGWGGRRSGGIILSDEEREHLERRK